MLQLSRSPTLVKCFLCSRHWPLQECQGLLKMKETQLQGTTSIRLVLTVSTVTLDLWDGWHQNLLQNVSIPPNQTAGVMGMKFIPHPSLSHTISYHCSTVVWSLNWWHRRNPIQICYHMKLQVKLLIRTWGQNFQITVFLHSPSYLTDVLLPNRRKELTSLKFALLWSNCNRVTHIPSGVNPTLISAPENYKDKLLFQIFQNGFSVY